MKDFTGEELKHNDLVVSKASGRYSSMDYGLIRDELPKSIWFGRGSWGGSDVVKIFTENRPNMERIRQGMITNREAELLAREAAKVDNRKNRIKKKDLTLYGVFSDKEDWLKELYIGKANIDGVDYENVWLYVKFPWTKGDEEPRNSLSDLVFRKNWNKPGFRVVKYPQKFKQLFQLTEEQVQGLLNEHVRYYVARGDHSYYASKPHVVRLMNGT